jgi:tryptophanyl-tRNA synthetase
MNRAHAYKAAVDANAAVGEDADAGITMGLYSYPILMAADILIFNAHRVPVGRDQVQHIEMARDIAQRFNHLFGAGRDFFVLPEAVTEESVATLPGLDGRKMSKSYDNTVPLFEGGAKALKAAVARIVTDSRLPGEPKDQESSSLLTIYRAFASAEESAAFRQALLEGLGWGEAKERLVQRLEQDLAPLRERYEALMARPADIEDLLQIGARKARAIAAPFLAGLRDAVGLRASAAPLAAEAKKAKAARPALQPLVYRDSDGRFAYKVQDAAKSVLASQGGFDDPKSAMAAAQAAMTGLVAD